MWKILQSRTGHMIKWRLPIACWITKDADTNSELEKYGRAENGTDKKIDSAHAS
jgi:hypothetical protein